MDIHDLEWKTATVLRIVISHLSLIVTGSTRKCHVEDSTELELVPVLAQALDVMRFRQRIKEESERTQRMRYDEFLQLCRDRRVPMQELPLLMS